MKEPYRLYTRCEKNGPAGRCPTWPRCCDWYDRPRRDGKKVWVHLPNTAGNKPAAYQLAGKLRLDDTLVKKGLKAPDRPPAPPLGAAVKDYLAAWTGRTKGKLVKILTGFVEAVGATVPVDAVTSTHVEKWLTALQERPSTRRLGKSWSKNSVQRYYNGVKGFGSWLVEKGWVEDSPCSPADRKERPAARRLWSPEEEFLIGELPARFRLPITIARLCSIRRSEALSLTRHSLCPASFEGWDVDGVQFGWIAVQRVKLETGEERLPIAMSLIAELREQLATPFQTYLFPHPTKPGEAEEPDAWSSVLTRELRKLGKAHGIDVAGLCMHGARHTAATAMQDAPGVSADTTRQMAGWTTLRMVSTYSHPGDAGKLKAAAHLAATFRGGRS